jgi:hypothetical protein
MTKIAGSGSRIRIRIRWSEAWIRGSGSGSTPKCHGSGTLIATYVFILFRVAYGALLFTPVIHFKKTQEILGVLSFSFVDKLL